MELNRITEVESLQVSTPDAKPVLYEGGISRTTLSSKHVKEKMSVGNH